MILFLDIRRDLVTLAAVDARGAKWLQLKGDGKVGAALAKAKRTFGFGRRKPSVIVAAMNNDEATSDTRNVSWSGIRLGVATANALAFAWNVPVAALGVRGDESRDDLAAGARAAAAKAKAGVWIRAAYNAEPNITQPKKVL